MHPLQVHFLRQTELNDAEFEKCLKYFDELQFARRDLVIKSGQQVECQYFVIEGCLRTYYLDEHDKEHTVQFAIENWWASDFISYYTGSESIMNVECIEDSRLLCITKDDLNSLFEEVPALEHFFRKQLENAFVAFQKRILANLHKTAEERYDDFIASYPNIEQRVKNYQIASYLGITAESLSRIRKLRMQH